MRVHLPSAGQHDPHAELEEALFEEFLRGHGVTWESLAKLPRREQIELLRGAATHATLKLSEMEARAHYVKEIGPSHE